MDQHMHKKEAPSFFFFLQFLTLFFLFCAGYSLVSLLHFAIEDTFHLPMKPFLLGDLKAEYADYLSLGLVFAGCFLVADFYQRWRLKERMDLFRNTVRYTWLALFFGMNVAIFCVDLIAIIHAFLSGKTHEASLLLTSTTFFLLFISFAYVYIQTRAPLFLMSRGYSFCVVTVTAIGVVAGITVTMIHAHPSLMRQARKEIKSLTLVDQKIPHEIEKYYDDHKALPQKLSDLGFWGELDQDHYAPITYKVLSVDTFSLCVSFQTEPHQVRRLGYRTTDENKKKKGCKTFTVLVDQKKKHHMVKGSPLSSA